MNVLILARPRTAAVVVAAGCSLLVLRPLLLRDGAHPTFVLASLFLLLLVVGRGWPRAAGTSAAAGGTSTAIALAAGVAAFALGRLVGGGHAPGSLTLRVVALVSLAAVAEEAFFRRFVYDAVFTPALAVPGSEDEGRLARLAARRDPRATAARRDRSDPSYDVLGPAPQLG